MPIAPQPSTPIAFGDACGLIAAALEIRADVVRELTQAADFPTALRRLRKAMQAHMWSGAGRHANLAPIVSAYDARTTDEGFHVLRDWDGRADSVLADTIPVDVLNYLIAQREGEAPDPTAIAILVDYYFFYLLVLLSVRIWDDDDADENLDRLGDLLACVQGPGGSGHRFVGDAATLLLLAGSHYELSDRGYDSLLDKIRTLAPRHRVAVALGHAASLGSHLRFGFEATYGRDVGAMRADNRPDYPWLCFALLVLVRELASDPLLDGPAHKREPLIEAILNGLSADPSAFLSAEVPAVLVACVSERRELREALCDRRQLLLAEAERHRPGDRAYSPFALFFNFSHNVVKGTVVDALLWGERRTTSLNDLLTAAQEVTSEAAAKQGLAETLMAYARAHPHTIRGRATPVVVYDPASGRQAFGAALRALANAR